MGTVTSVGLYGLRCGGRNAAQSGPPSTQSSVPEKTVRVIILHILRSPTCFCALVYRVAYRILNVLCYDASRVVSRVAP